MRYPHTPALYNCCEVGCEALGIEAGVSAEIYHKFSKTS